MIPDGGAPSWEPLPGGRTEGPPKGGPSVIGGTRPPRRGSRRRPGGARKAGRVVGGRRRRWVIPPGCLAVDTASQGNASTPIVIRRHWGSVPQNWAPRSLTVSTQGERVAICAYERVSACVCTGQPVDSAWLENLSGEYRTACGKCVAGAVRLGSGACFTRREE